MKDELFQWVKVCLVIAVGTFVANTLSPLFDFRFKGPIDPIDVGMLLEIIIYSLRLVPFTASTFLLAYIIVVRRQRVGIFKLGVIALMNQLLVVIVVVATGPYYNHSGNLLLAFALGIVSLFLMRRKLVQVTSDGTVI